MATERILFDVPNLDGLTIDPADMTIAADVLASLSAYARYKALSMGARLEGRMQDAAACERHMDLLYRGLPEWARW